MPNSELVHSVLKALDILQLVADSPRGLRVSEIAAGLALKPAAVCNLLRTLAARGYLVKDGTGTYVLGPAPAELQQRMRRRKIFRSGGALLQKLAARYPLAVLTLSELTSGGICCRLRLSPDRPGELQHPLDRFFSPYISLSGQCLLAFSPEAGNVRESPSFEEECRRYWPDLSLYFQEQTQIRRRGYAFRLYPDRTVGAAFYVPDRYAIGIRGVREESISLPDSVAEIRMFFDNLWKDEVE